MIAGAWLSSPASSRGRIGRLKTKLISDGSGGVSLRRAEYDAERALELGSSLVFSRSKNPASLDTRSTRALEARGQEGKEYENAM